MNATDSLPSHDYGDIAAFLFIACIGMLFYIFHLQERIDKLLKARYRLERLISVMNISGEVSSLVLFYGYIAKQSFLRASEYWNAVTTLAFGTNSSGMYMGKPYSTLSELIKLLKENGIFTKDWREVPTINPSDGEIIKNSEAVKTAVDKLRKGL